MVEFHAVSAYDRRDVISISMFCFIDHRKLDREACCKRKADGYQSTEFDVTSAPF